MYNRYKNYETWAVVYYISNDEFFYSLLQKVTDWNALKELITSLNIFSIDGVDLTSKALDINALDKMVLDEQM